LYIWSKLGLSRY